jgi:hypothetical protein
MLTFGIYFFRIDSLYILNMRMNLFLFLSDKVINLFEAFFKKYVLILHL